MADALTYQDDDETTETRVFVRMIDKFFDCLNVKSHLEAVKKRKDNRKAYTSSGDQRFKVCSQLYKNPHVPIIIVAKGYILEILGRLEV